MGGGGEVVGWCEWGVRGGWCVVEGVSARSVCWKGWWEGGWLWR